MQQHLQYQHQLQQYQQFNNQQHFNGLVQQHNASAAVNFCKRLQQQQQPAQQQPQQQPPAQQQPIQNPEEQDNNILFQNAMMNCGLGGLQSRHLLNLQLQNLCERMQVDRNLLPFSGYPNFQNMNSPQISDYMDDSRAFSGLESFRRNTPSETESDHTQTTVPLVSNSSAATDDTRSVSRSSNVLEGSLIKGKETPCNFDHIPEDSETELSLSEDSGSEVGTIDASDLSDREDDVADNSSVKTGVGCNRTDSVDSKVSPVVRISIKEMNENDLKTGDITKTVSNGVCEASKTDPPTSPTTEVIQEPTAVTDSSIDRNRSPFECCKETNCISESTDNLPTSNDCEKELEKSPKEVSSSDESSITATVLTCNCLIAKERASPSSISSTKSLDDSTSTIGSPPSDCKECSLHQEEIVPNLHNSNSDKAKCSTESCENNNDKYFFDQSFHLSLKQDLGYQKA